MKPSVTCAAVLLHEAKLIDKEINSFPIIFSGKKIINFKHFLFYFFF